MRQPIRHNECVEESAVKEHWRVQRGEAVRPVIDGETIDCEATLEACGNTPKMKRNNVGHSDATRKNAWVADSGVSHHVGNSDIGMTNVRRIDLPAQIGNGKTL